MKFKRILIGIIGSAIACGVFADPEWKFITLNNGFEVYVDTNSITNVSEYNYRQNKQFWIKQLVFNDLKQDGLGVGDYRKIFYWVNCSANTYGVKAVAEYKKQKNGTFNNKSVSIPNYQVEMNPTIPGSVGESFASHVCP